eukprot:8394162-Pyramimonas_sp.AAC.1
MEEDFDYVNKEVSLSRELASLVEAEHPAQGERRTRLRLRRSMIGSLQDGLLHLNSRSRGTRITI